MKLFHTPVPLTPGSTIQLDAPLQHRLSKVLRMGQGAHIRLFDGHGTAAEAEIADAKCRTAHILAALPPQSVRPPLTLVLGLPKRDAWETALRQATELGATAILPLKTDFSQVGKLNAERAQATVTEAAEQSERHTLPALHPVATLAQFLQGLTQPCAWAYERLEGGAATTPAAAMVLVGPEGGFSPAEVALLRAHPHIVPFSLGTTILRTDTAVVAALARLAR
jgi:16S rRNA (uracil1498-N3)-methyltransferase